LKSYAEAFIPGIGRHILYDLFPFFLAFSHWGNHLSISDKRPDEEFQEKDQWYILGLILSYGLCMASAAIPKYLSGWLDISDQATYWALQAKYRINQNDMFLINFLANLKEGFIWEFLDYTTVLFEFFALLLIPLKRVYRFFYLYPCSFIFLSLFL